MSGLWGHKPWDKQKVMRGRGVGIDMKPMGVGGIGGEFKPA
ncbi:hypothetical protein ACFLUZ_02180 [Chloroflexota bacterium]